MSGSVFESQRQHVPEAFITDDIRDLAGALRDWIEVDDSLDCLRPRAGHGSSLRRSRPMSWWPPRVRAVHRSSSSIPRIRPLAAARLAELWHGLGLLLAYDSTHWAGI